MLAVQEYSNPLCIMSKHGLHLPLYAEARPSCYSRTLLDSAFENEAKCKSETEAAKREVLRLSDKLEQVHKPLKMLHPPINVLIEYK